MMKNFRSFFTVILTVLVLTACSKEDIIPVVDENLINQENVTEEIMTGIDALSEEAVNLKLSEGKSAFDEGDFYLGTCPVITFYKNADPQVIIIDFGTACEGKDGKIRSGRIIITSEKFDDGTSLRTKTFDDFYTDGKKVEGTVSKTFTLIPEDHIRVAEIEEDITITFPDNEGTVSRKANLTRRNELKVIGITRDNVVTSWGIVEFTRLNGIKVTKTIDESAPLVFKASCRRIVSGIVNVTTSDNRSWTINYGDGECDNNATVTNGDRTRVIKLR
jgi:hypothetical protein